MDKKKLDKILKFIAIVAAAFVFCIMVYLTANYAKGKDASYDIVCLGDSNFGNNQNDKGVAALLSKKVGKTVLNGAFGGSMMTNKYEKKTGYYSALSMYNLAVSICNGNFGVQKSAIDAIARRDYIGYFENSLEKLSKADFDSVEILVIEHGLNDYFAGVPIKNGVDPYDINTFTGALRSSVEMLRNKYPQMRIILVTPVFCMVSREDGNFYPCDEITFGGRYLEDYVNAELVVAEELGVEIVDLYHGMNMNSENCFTYLDDGLHFSDYGREIAVDMIADCILGEAK